MKRWLHLAWILTLGLGILITQPSHAAPGVPGSPDLALGVTFYPEGHFSEVALQSLAILKPHWVSVPLAWQRFQPSPETTPDLSFLDPLMQIAAREGLAVMISLTQPPAWALVASGPDATLTTQLILTLTQRYPGVVQAVELFPGANTPEGWGSLPNPSHYAHLYLEVQKALQDQIPSVHLVAAGLQPPTPSQIANGAMDDLQFLEGLYQNGLVSRMPILSLQLPLLSGDPLKPASASTPWVLRHYEQVRQVMLSHHHAEGMLWITRLAAPDGKINPEDRTYLATEYEMKWWRQALVQIRSQLYIGTVFVYDLNPAPADPTPTRSLILGTNERHPLYPWIRWLLQQNCNGDSHLGRPKDQALTKSRDRP
ncbi:hypothetical protein [uncultured Thermanaerothrix sp.]|uniref:hypothetical protein n=1 Tax=uncultured Thermanaerothrix sp. TaxID=1195149 RepID=UPI002602C25F|nr:hypothetical protein [uncultured Thermanaerothrix sp.]